MKHIDEWKPDWAKFNRYWQERDSGGPEMYYSKWKHDDRKYKRDYDKIMSAKPDEELYTDS